MDIIKFVLIEVASNVSWSKILHLMLKVDSLHLLLLFKLRISYHNGAAHFCSKHRQEKFIALSSGPTSTWLGMPPNFRPKNSINYLASKFNGPILFLAKIPDQTEDKEKIEINRMIHFDLFTSLCYSISILSPSNCLEQNLCLVLQRC